MADLNRILMESKIMIKIFHISQRIKNSSMECPYRTGEILEISVKRIRRKIITKTKNFNHKSLKR